MLYIGGADDIEGLPTFYTGFGMVLAVHVTGGMLLALDMLSHVLLKLPAAIHTHRHPEREDLSKDT